MLLPTRLDARIPMASVSARGGVDSSLCKVTCTDYATILDLRWPSFLRLPRPTNTPPIRLDARILMASSFLRGGVI
jgi:hypothetical protein